MKWLRLLFRQKTNDIGTPLMSPSFEHTPPKLPVEEKVEPLPVVVDERPYLCSECEKEWAPHTLYDVIATEEGNYRIRVRIICAICGITHSRPTVSTKAVREKVNHG